MIRHSWLSVALLACVCITACSEKRGIQWDLSSSHSTQAIGWSTEEDVDVRDYPGPVAVDVLFPESRRLKIVADGVSVLALDGKVLTVTLTFKSRSRTQAQSIVSDILAQLKFSGQVDVENAVFGERLGKGGPRIARDESLEIECRAVKGQVDDAWHVTAQVAFVSNGETSSQDAKTSVSVISSGMPYLRSRAGERARSPRIGRPLSNSK